MTGQWPQLDLSAWDDTRATVHMWTQVVGKVRLALEPAMNHWWQVPLYVSASGLTTSLVHTPDRGIEIEFDFIDHVLVARTTDGAHRTVALEPRTVASFYEATMSALAELDVNVDIMARPVEVVEAIPFPDDVTHRAYDADAVHRFWLALVQADRILRTFRSRFVGKASPVHFFWGALDLATTRFSGRAAPEHPGGVPNCPDWVMHEAYNSELSSCGFWPGGSDEGSFYAYAYPEPDGFRGSPVVPEGAYYDAALGEFILPYGTVRTADDPDALVLAFLQSTYDAAATLANWDRSTLERGD
ncbi:MAG: DUF5996 family protein [Acidimicrobiia bacterium]